MNLPDILNEITNRLPADLAACPLPELDRLCRELAELKSHLRRGESALQTALDTRYRDAADALRRRAGKVTGTVRFEDAGFLIVADLPKKVEYDQAKLHEAVATLRSWGERPEDYVGFEIKVAETKYQAWPPAIRTLFEPARTLSTGKASYTLAPVAAEQGGTP